MGFRAEFVIFLQISNYKLFDFLLRNLHLYVTNWQKNMHLYIIVEPLVLPQPNHYRRKLHVVDSWDDDTRHGITDTNWHIFHKRWTKLDPNDLNCRVLEIMCIFAFQNTHRPIT